MKAYKFMAQYKKNKEDKFKDFKKYLWLSSEEVTMTGENYGLKFLEVMVNRGDLPKGIYDEVRLYEWKTKKKHPSETRKRVNWIKAIPKSKRNK